MTVTQEQRIALKQINDLLNVAAHLAANVGLNAYHHDIERITDDIAFVMKKIRDQATGR